MNHKNNDSPYMYVLVEIISFLDICTLMWTVENLLIQHGQIKLFFYVIILCFWGVLTIGLRTVFIAKTIEGLAQLLHFYISVLLLSLEIAKFSQIVISHNFVFEIFDSTVITQTISHFEYNIRWNDATYYFPCIRILTA